MKELLWSSMSLAWKESELVSDGIRLKSLRETCCPSMPPVTWLTTTLRAASNLEVSLKSGRIACDAEAVKFGGIDRNHSSVRVTL